MSDALINLCIFADLKSRDAIDVILSEDDVQLLAELNEPGFPLAVALECNAVKCIEWQNKRFPFSAAGLMHCVVGGSVEVLKVLDFGSLQHKAFQEAILHKKFENAKFLYCDEYSADDLVRLAIELEQFEYVKNGGFGPLHCILENPYVFKLLDFDFDVQHIFFYLRRGDYEMFRYLIMKHDEFLTHAMSIQILSSPQMTTKLAIWFFDYSRFNPSLDSPSFASIPVAFLRNQFHPSVINPIGLLKYPYSNTSPETIEFAEEIKPGIIQECYGEKAWHLYTERVSSKYIETLLGFMTTVPFFCANYQGLEAVKIMTEKWPIMNGWLLERALVEYKPQVVHYLADFDCGYVITNKSEMFDSLLCEFLSKNQFVEECDLSKHPSRVHARYFGVHAHLFPKEVQEYKNDARIARFVLQNLAIVAILPDVLQDLIIDYACPSTWNIIHFFNENIKMPIMREIEFKLPNLYSLLARSKIDFCQFVDYARPIKMKSNLLNEIKSLILMILE